MAREDLILGFDDSTGYVLPHVTNINVQPSIQTDTASFDENRFGGFFIGKQPGVSKITLSFNANVNNPDFDALDILYGEILTEIYNRAGTTPTQLWTQDEWFYEVGLSNITEDERTEYYVKFAVEFIARRGKLYHKDLTNFPLTNGSTFTILSPLIADPWIDVNTTIGNQIIIGNNRSSGVIQIDPTQNGLLRLYLHDNMAYRVNGIVETDAASEISFAWPRWPSNVATTISINGVTQVDFNYRKAMLGV